MSTPKNSHIFSKRPSMTSTIETITSWSFRLATYFVILCAGYLFLDITINGSKAVFTTKAPFINVAFLTEKPQTLHVFEPKEIDAELKTSKAKILSLQAESRNLGSGETGASSELEAQIKALKEKITALDIERKANRLMYGDNDYRALTEEPSSDQYVYSNYAYSGGGIGPAIVGTCLLVAGSITIALILGILCAIFLSEYSRPGKTLQLIRLSVLNLSGVPSIVFGLFGFGMFVLFFGWGVSLLAGWFTLAIMALPVIIAASEESMRAIPKGFREGSLALGASKWTSVRTNVLPYALPGILTSSIMGVARVAGETAPIMFTAAFALRDQLPWEGLAKPTDFFFQGVMALPYHIYVVSSKIPQNEYTRNMQYGAAFVFLLIVGFFALSSIILRIQVRKKYKW
ncbi:MULTISPECIES: phosphate ABC transporter permease PstA [unclassified Lentimonas]|uniref:phosphate ABC transporter permease PstA n=1 Tax=unclassified Lentimonas TaxID=2630993 RepID=UPI0013299729|nr:MULTISPECIES: phosphate ABC transporter permease PstA [unclassified Lentimonas]CAA6691646.1 Phosphate transport system permease protein PstA (TC 3.A.1.7.1) [Lentimonas sp. CC10]CAA6696296.1 Phosphate transport system permease protein PstA (TC 3.A.1.7.1) [Lentimonas sp. CC19]CAA7070829.1 Phosphate transport system permease protein PstA (TC 3.A.1.7.1) [Lentimonas sp. CC11]